MNIVLNDICDLTIYGIRNKLMRLQGNEFTRVTFADSEYVLEMTATKASVFKLVDKVPIFSADYKLDNEYLLAFASISQMIFKLCDIRYPSGRK